MPRTNLRLDKYIASVTDFSRSEAKRLIKAGRVEVGAEVVLDPQRHLDPEDRVSLEGRALRPALFRYFMLNKPAGYVSAARDRRHPVVTELLFEDNPERLHLAGRLDIDTTGLLLITDDGQWAHAVMSPRRACWKRYRVETAEPIADGVAERFAKGLYLDEEKRRTRPAELTVIDTRLAYLRISEGRFHQVKRMFAAVGNAVTGLHREAIGDIELDPALAPGEYRPLSDNEVASISR